MPLCFLTGVQFSLDDAYVINRREAFHLAKLFEDRARSLRRLIEQLSPLNEAPGDHQRVAADVRSAVANRLVFRAVADALGGGFPDIRLFVPLPEYALQ